MFYRLLFDHYLSQNKRSKGYFALTHYKWIGSKNHEPIFLFYAFPQYLYLYLNDNSQGFGIYFYHYIKCILPHHMYRLLQGELWVSPFDKQNLWKNCSAW